MNTPLEKLLAFCAKTPGEKFDQSTPFLQGPHVYFAGERAIVRVDYDVLKAAYPDIGLVAENDKISRPFASLLKGWEPPPNHPPRLHPTVTPYRAAGCSACEGSKTIQHFKLCPTCDGTGRHVCSCKFCKQPCTHCNGAKQVVDGPPRMCTLCNGTGAECCWFQSWLFPTEEFVRVLNLPNCRGVLIGEFKKTSKALRFDFDGGEGLLIGLSKEIVEEALTQEFASKTE